MRHGMESSERSVRKSEAQTVTTEDEMLDIALEATFPASDPIAICPSRKEETK